MSGNLKRSGKIRECHLVRGQGIRKFERERVTENCGLILRSTFYRFRGELNICKAVSFLRHENGRSIYSGHHLQSTIPVFKQVRMHFSSHRKVWKCYVFNQGILGLKDILAILNKGF